MIITVDELKQYISTDVDDQVLEAKLQALEVLIRKYTNNNFQIRQVRYECPIVSQKLYLAEDHLAVGDTVQISETEFNDGIYVIEDKSNGFVKLDRELYDESNALVTLIKYPFDVQMGAVNMIQWDLNNRDKVGIQSETISRHSVTYFNLDGDNSVVGYPKSLIGFLKPYMKARF